MIAIINVSEEFGLSYLPHGSHGVQLYRVQLNNIPLTTFEHYTELGMDQCLLAAHEALAKVDIDQKINEYHTKQIYKLIEAGEGLGYD